MDLKDLLSEKGIDAKMSRVLVMRHVPMESAMKEALPGLAAEYPDVYNAFEQAHYPRAEKQLAQAAFLASFIGHRAKEALLVGLYRVRGSHPISYEEYWKIPANITLKKLGMTGWTEANHRSAMLWFDLELTDTLQEWKGKLVVGWPPLERNWTRWADSNAFPIKAILEESSLDKGMPPWNELILTWEKLAYLPKSWIAKLSEWRGIYLIVDGTDGKGYVGSACGEENLYGRWRNYADSGDGGNQLLRKRVPDKFVFSILELVSPTMNPQDVIQIESSWKKRLHTREFGNLNAN
jgi:hypothetical protein